MRSVLRDDGLMVQWLAPFSEYQYKLLMRTFLSVFPYVTLWSNGDLLVDPICRELAHLLPAPPRVEVSALGESAVLDGALAIGREEALDRVFEQRPVAL